MASATWFGTPEVPYIISRDIASPTKDSYRAELDDVIYFLETFQPIQHLLPTQSLTFSLDNESVVKLSNSPHFCLYSSQIDFKYSPQKLALHHYLYHTPHSFFLQ